MDNETRFFTLRDTAIEAAKVLEDAHDVEVRQVAPRRFALYIDAACLYCSGFRIYTNRGTC